MRFIIPTPKDAYRLVNDLQLPHGVGVTGGERVSVLPAGTIIAVETMRWNKTFRMSSSVGFRILMSPDNRLSLKKHGGTNTWGSSFSLTNEQVRELEVELVEDFK